MVLFILLGGYPPFYDENEPALFAQIRRGAFSFDDPVWDSVSDRCAPRRVRVCGRLCDSFGLVCPERLEVLWDLCSRDRWRLPSLCMLCCKKSLYD